MIIIQAFAHFFGGALSYYVLKKDYKSLFAFLCLGAIAISPDIDFFFGNNAILGHRRLTHSLIFTVMFGIITWIFLKSFWAGAIAHFSHRILDMYVGWLYPLKALIPSSWPLFMQANSVIITSLFGGVLLLIILLVEGRKWLKIK